MKLTIGEPCPGFRAPGNSNPSYVFDSAAGRHILLAVLSEANEAQFDAALATIAASRGRFDDAQLCFFGLVGADAPWRPRAQDDLPGVRWLFDAGEIRSRLIGDEAPCWILLDPTLRVLGHAQLDATEALAEALARLPDVERHGGVASHAPILIVPRVFEPEFCTTLIDHYETTGGQHSGFMREVNGMTRLVHDFGHKRRQDVMLETGPLTQVVQARIARRLIPEIEKVFQFKATRIERYLIAAYDAETGGHFRPHRDNTTKATAHRRFAVSINLNADYDGADLRFPEFGSTTFRPPVGGAAVFSCSLLHEATAVTRGRRFAFLPFLYDEAAAEIRQANLKYLSKTGVN